MKNPIAEYTPTLSQRGGRVSLQCDTAQEASEVFCWLEQVAHAKPTQAGQESPPRIADLTMLIGRLVRQVRKHDPNNTVAEQAMAYLRRKDLSGSILREQVPDVGSCCGPTGCPVGPQGDTGEPGRD